MKTYYFIEFEFEVEDTDEDTGDSYYSYEVKYLGRNRELIVCGDVTSHPFLNSYNEIFSTTNRGTAEKVLSEIEIPDGWNPTIKKFTFSIV